MGTTSVEPVNILLVDDRPENLTALVSILEQPGYRLTTASSAADALRWVLREPFAVILLDVLMPIMDGIELATLIKSRDRSRDLPIIFLTASGMDVDRILTAYSLGAVDYLVRPVQPEVVQAKVSVFAELFRKTEEIKRQAKLLREHDLRESDRQLAELKSQHERRYRDLADSIPQMVWRTAADGSAIYYTERWREFTGLSQEESLGWSWLSALHPDDRPGFRAKWLTALHLGTTFEAECRIRRAADGAFVWHLCQGVPETDAAGAILGWFGAYTDVDAQKRADEERAELLRRAQVARAHAEEMQRRMAILADVSRLLSESLDLSISLDKVARHLVDTMSRGCILEIAGEEGQAGRLAVAHRNPEEEALLREQFEQKTLTLDGDTLVTTIEMRAGAASSITLLGTMSSAGWNDEERAFVGDIARRIGLFVENAGLYEKARRAIAVRDEFLSIAAHELRTPLTAMMLHIQTLARSLRKKGREPFSIDAALVKIDAAERQLGRLTHLIEALLDVSRVASRRLTLDFQEVELASVVHDVVAKFAETSAQEGSTIDVRAEEPVVGHWDQLRIEQVVTNLVANAIKYGPGRPIELTAKTDDGMAVLVVKDHGIGIAPESQGRIFDRFERAVSAVSYGGLGLGLYLTRQIVIAHGGTIAVKSELGKGAEFTVRLPFSAKGSAAQLLDDADQRADLDRLSQHA
jgi:PAS domain S-box-containing protein